MSAPKLEIREYWGFISYSHADEKSAVWLHRHLERYRFPRRLRGRKTTTGILPKSIAPLFRDRDEFAGASDLTEAATLALRCSRSLVVVCSPSAARSEWVGREVRIFKALGRSHRIFCIIVDGDAARPAAENFPDAVTENDEPPGMPAGTPLLPLACDARPGKDGKRNAALKLLAAIVDVPYDELHSRERRRRRIRRSVGSAAAALFCACVLLFGWLLSNRNNAAEILRAVILSSNREDKAAVNQALWQLTHRSEWVCQALFQTVASDQGAASGLVGYPSLIEAFAGLSPGMRWQFGDDVLSDCYGARNTKTETGLACTALAIGLDEGSLRGIEFLLKRAGRKYDSGELFITGEFPKSNELTAAEYMSRRLPPKDVPAAVDLTLAMLARQPDVYSQSKYFQLLGRMADRLPPNRRSEVVARARELQRTNHCGPAVVLASIPGVISAGEAISLYRQTLDEALLPDSRRCDVWPELLTALLKAMDPKNRLEQIQVLLDRLAQIDVTRHMIWAEPVLHHFAQELRPDDWREYVSRVVPAAAANLEGAALHLQPVPPQYCGREAARIFFPLMEQRWLKSRGSPSLEDSSVRAALKFAGAKLAPADGARAAEKIGALMKNDLQWDVADLLNSIPDELRVPALAPRFDSLFAEWQRSPGDTRCLRSLASKLPPAAAGDALERVLRQLELPNFQGDESRLREGAELIEALAASLPASGRKRPLHEVVSLLEREQLVPCSVLSPFVAEETFPLIVAVAKWPTCAPGDRTRLIQRVGNIVNLDFAVDTSYTDIWGFIRWAEKRGYDVESRPSARLPRVD